MNESPYQSPTLELPEDSPRQSNGLFDIVLWSFPFAATFVCRHRAIAIFEDFELSVGAISMFFVNSSPIVAILMGIAFAIASRRTTTRQDFKIVRLFSMLSIILFMVVSLIGIFAPLVGLISDLSG